MKAHAVRVPAVDGATAVGRNAGQSQARVPAVSRGRIGHADSAAPPDALQRNDHQSSGSQAESALVDGFRE